MSRYLRTLWTGALPLSRVLWFDTLVIGTVVNLASLVVTMILFAEHAPTPIAVAVFLLPMPFNIALVTGVWRSAAREKAEAAWFGRAVAVAWLIVVTVAV